MIVTRRQQGENIVFLVTEIDPALHAAARAVALEPMDDGFGRVFPANQPHIDQIFRNFARHIEAFILQKADLRPAPWAETLLAFCQIVEDQQIDWWLTGSAALAVRGLRVAPRDLDLVVAPASARSLEHLMLPYMIEPPRPGFISDTFCRAFLHACVEWCAGIDERADQHMVGDVGLVAQSRLETAPWRGYDIRVPPLDLQLAVNRARGLQDRVALIEQAMSEA